LVLAVAVVELVGAVGSISTARGIAEWYGTLVRPALVPPDWVFAPVWTVLFALMGAAVWLIWWRVSHSPLCARRARLALGLFGVQFLFNLGWSVAFFGLRSIELGLGVIGGLWGLIVLTTWAFARVDRRAAALMIPYLVWVSFAAYLNYRFWVLN
jgi:tryptophan-rich sensory protein